MNEISYLLISLVLTILLEFIVYLIFIRKNVGKLFLYSMLINAFTNPLANLFSSEYIFYLYGIELAVIIVESFFIMLLLKMRYWKAFLLSFIANLVSAILGFFILVKIFC